MATRLYLPSHGSLSINPTPDASWEDVTAVVKRNLAMWPGMSAMASVTVTEGTSGVNARDLLHGMFVSPPLAAGSFSGVTLKGQMRALESNAAANCMTQIVVRLLNSAGAVKSVLYAGHSATAVADEYGTTLSNRRNPYTAVSPVTLANFTAADGDRLVVELGTRFNNTVTTSYTAQLNFGGNGASDLAEDITTTTANNPWVEFSADFNFLIPQRHSSTPAATKTSATSTTTVSPSFQPPVDSTIVVSWTSDEITTGQQAPTIAASGFTVGSWTLVVGRKNGVPAGADNGYCYLWYGKVTASPAAGTITITHASLDRVRMLVCSVYDPTQVDNANPIGATASGSFTSGTAFSASVTPLGDRSGLRLAYLDWNATNVPTPAADCAISELHNAAGLSTNGLIAHCLPTVAGVSQAIAVTFAGAVTDGNWVMYELLAPSVPVAPTQFAAFGVPL